MKVCHWFLFWTPRPPRNRVVYISKGRCLRPESTNSTIKKCSLLPSCVAECFSAMLNNISKMDGHCELYTTDQMWAEQDWNPLPIQLLVSENRFSLVSERVQSYYLIFAKILFEGMVFCFVLNPEWEHVLFYHSLHKVLSLGKATYPFDGDFISSCLGSSQKGKPGHTDMWVQLMNPSWINLWEAQEI